MSAIIDAETPGTIKRYKVEFYDTLKSSGPYWGYLHEENIKSCKETIHFERQQDPVSSLDKISVEVLKEANHKSAIVSLHCTNGKTSSGFQQLISVLLTLDLAVSEDNNTVKIDLKNKNWLQKINTIILAIAKGSTRKMVNISMVTFIFNILGLNKEEAHVTHNKIMTMLFTPAMTPQYDGAKQHVATPIVDTDLSSKVKCLH